MLYDFPEKYFKFLPRFNGEDNVSTKKHITVFEDFIDYLNIKHDDVFMRMFTQYFEGEVRRWFRYLESNAISSWNGFLDLFLHKWDEMKNHHQYLFEFYSIKRRKDETITKFNRRFENLYHNFPIDINPFEYASNVYYTLCYDPGGAYMGLNVHVMCKYMCNRVSLIVKGASCIVCE